MPVSVPVTIPYGDKTCTFEVPSANMGEVLIPRRVDVPRDGDAVLAAALNNSIGTPPLEQLAHGKREVAIIVDDLTRPTPVDHVLPLVLERLNAAGIEDARIRVIIALGTHRPMTQEEICTRLGPEPVRRVRVLNSHFDNPAELMDCGQAPDGTRLWVDRQVMACDLRIGIGTILPHPTAGWGGGAKIIYPGVGGTETVSHFHLQQTRLDHNVFGDITSPIRANMERWVGHLGLDYIVNVICTPEGEVYKAVAGHFVQAHRQGVVYAQEIYAVPAASRAPIVITGSYPADLDFWQALKALMSADLVTEDGGTMILVTPCPEGIGPHSNFAELVGDEDPESLAARALAGELKNPYVAAGGVTLSRIRRRTGFAIVSDGLDAAECAKMKAHHLKSAQQAVDWALARHGAAARVVVIPYGAETVPMVGV